MADWISVEERMPAMDTEVLVFAVGLPEWGFEGKTTMAIAHRFIYRFWSGGKEHESWSTPWEYFHKDYKITHWMPLPEHPKEGGDGMIISELHLEEEPKPHKCSCGATPRITYNGLLWVVECPKCFNIESGWAALGVINAWNRKVDAEGGSEE